MAACRSLQHIFENPLKESLFETFSSCSPIKSMNPIDNASFSDLFGELKFQENDDGESNTPPLSSSPASSVSSSSSSSFSNDKRYKTPKKQYRHEDSFSSMSSEPVSHCTEGIGFESSDEVEEYEDDNISLDWRHRREEKQGANVVQYRSEYMYCDHRRSRLNRESFPPPISCIGGNGKPFVSFRTYRENGRFILTEVRIPQQEFLRASRENGRLKLQLIHSDDDIFEDEEFDDDDEDEEDFDHGDTEDVDDEDTTRDDSVNQGEEKEFDDETNVDEEPSTIT